MKNIKILLAAALTLVAFASCSKLNDFPVFEADQSYVAFAKSSYTIAEDGGQLVIPVSIASYGTEADKNLPKTNVSYKLLDKNSEGSKYTAEKGLDFDDANVDGVLVFDGTKMTQNIVIDIKNRVGEYTGDITFGIELSTASNNLKIAAENLVKTTITDNDHPLASILGEYTVTSYAPTDPTTAVASYTMTLTKDPADVHVVHIDYIVHDTKTSFASWGDWSVVGTVSDDLKTITVAVGQTCGQGSDNPAWYQSKSDVFELYEYELTPDGMLSISKTGNIEFVSTTPGVFTTESNIWLYPVETAKFYSNFGAHGPITWTKN